MDALVLVQVGTTYVAIERDSIALIVIRGLNYIEAVSNYIGVS